MRTALRRIFDEDWIVILASAIALGYVVLNLAEATGNVIVTALESQSEEQLFASDAGPLGFTVADHAIVLGPIVQGLVALAIVLAAVAFAVSRLHRASGPPSADAP